MQKEQIWGSRLEFTLTIDDNPMYRIMDWLEERSVLFCIFISYSQYDNTATISILLPPENDKEAVYLSFWKECISVNRYKD